jgi:hypothetical protein
VAKVPDPGLELLDFMNYVSHAFNMGRKFASKDAFLIDFDRFLDSTSAAGKKVLLIIDEAQRLRADMLDEIRQLSNFEKQQKKLLDILFVGQNQFNEILREKDNRALHQRIAVNAAIGPLDFDETADYIHRSLKTAGGEKEIFTPEAIRGVYQFSGGIFRMINIICDHALVKGVLRGRKTVTADMVWQCAVDLCLPGSSGIPYSIPMKPVGDFAIGGEKTGQPARRAKAGSGGARKAFGTVIIAVMVALIVAYLRYPVQSEQLMHRVKDKGLHLLGLSGRISIPEVSVEIEPFRQTVSASQVDAPSATPVVLPVPLEVPVADEQQVENVETVELAAPKVSTEAAWEEIGEVIPEESEVVFPEEKMEGVQKQSIMDASVEVAEGVPGKSTELMPEESRATALEESPEAAPESEAAQVPPTDTAATADFAEVHQSGRDMIVEYLKKSAADRPGQNVVPGESEEREEVPDETRENVDPGAVIDWVLKNRAE